MANKFFNRTFLITGGAGFIGRCLAKALLDKGAMVVVYDNLNSGRYESIKKLGAGDNFEFVKGDILDTKKLSESFGSDIDVVIHLAAITSNIEFEKNLGKCYKTNVEGFLNVLEQARRNGCGRVLYASSSAVYLKESGFSEDSYIDIKKQKNHYAKTKLINEMMADSYAKEHGIWLTGMRFFNVYGSGENAKGNYASIISQFLECRRLWKKLVVYGNGEQRRDFIHVDDLSEIILKLVDNGKESLYNIGTGKAVSYREIAEIIDKDNIRYVKNPLKSYQLLTLADNRKLIRTIGDYKFMSVRDWARKMLNGADA